MRVNDTEIQMSNYSEFKSEVRKHGLSVNNFYDVKIELEPSSPLYGEMAKVNGLQMSQTVDLMRLYTDEASIPGVQMTTGDYRITNTPNLKYAYGSVFSEVNFSFLMDADSRIKSVFDVWTNWIYGYSGKRDAFLEVFGIEFANRTPKLRTRYRDDYAVDIVITKYERSMSSHANRPGDDSPNYSVKDIIPGSTKSGGTKFYRAVPVYAVRLFKAFPSNVSSIDLNSGSTELSKLSVSFEFETMTSSALNDGKINGAILDPINGGGDSLDILGLFGLT